jgi:pimeloyl-ACP methyl ester carboxylesterase
MRFNQRDLCRLLAGSFSLLGLPLVAAQGAEPPKIVTEEAMVPSHDAGIAIYVRNKHPADMTSFAPDRTVVFVHGATYPAETAFDLPLDGLSWMDYIARRGFDVYLLDVRGYGKSTRPREMDEPADKNPPIVSTAVAAGDVDAVVDYVRARRHIDKVNLIGWSWGTAIMATYAAENAAKVNRLVLYATVWHRETPSLVQVAGTLGAYRGVTREAALARWLTGVPEDKKADLIPVGWFEAWADATFASDPVGAAQNPPVLRAPNGVVKDGLDFWSQGKATYDPARIIVPVLLIQAAWDQDTPPYMSQKLFPLLVNAPSKRYVMIGEGTHTVVMERNRLQLFNEVQLFLEEGFRS